MDGEYKGYPLYVVYGRDGITDRYVVDIKGLRVKRGKKGTIGAEWKNFSNKAILLSYIINDNLFPQKIGNWVLDGDNIAKDEAYYSLPEGSRNALGGTRAHVEAVRDDRGYVEYFDVYLQDANKMDSDDVVSVENKKDLKIYLSEQTLMTEMMEMKPFSNLKSATGKPTQKEITTERITVTQ